MSSNTETAGDAAATTTTMSSPLGDIVIVAHAGAVCEIRLPDATIGLPRASREPPESPERRELYEPHDSAEPPASTADGVPGEARRQLAEYFAGRRREFELPLELRGTAFQERVWRALLDVRYGETVSYAELARAVGAPTSARAVGAAVARNPLPIVVPCHRVIGSAGDLRGFASGLARKRWLLQAETADGRR
jgi:methylated-DNA-[protein]-cysteine S-methyltransferase